MSQVRDPSHAFARMDLGPTLELPVEVPSSVPLDPWRTPRFAWLEDGRDMLVGGDPVHTFPLTFSDPRHPRQLRRFLQEASLTIARLSLAEHAEEAGVHAGKLSLTRTARFVELSGPLVITINDEACRSWTGRTSPDPDLAKRLCFDLPGRSTGFSVIRTPVLLHAEQEVSQISVLSADGWELQGLLEEQGSRARIAIHAASQLEGVGPGNQVRYGGALLALGGGLQLAAAGSEGPWMDLADHSVLRPSNNRILSAWLRYHELERQRAEQLLEARNKPLRYDTARQQQDGWELAIACLPEVLQPWLPADDKGRRTIKVDQAVEVLGAGSDEVICTGSVTRLRQVDPSQGTAKALLSLDSTKGERSPPPNNGRLRAVADRGQGRQASRRREAAERLVRGDTINPRVLTWLTEPTSLGTPQRKHRAPMLRPAPDATQQEAVAKALGLEDLLLIQGPPGTGKTQVIVEILLQLARLWRGRDEPLRILVSSIQNDAVRNAVDKLRRARSEDGGAAPEISVYHLPKQKERAAFAERMAEDGQSAALALRQASQGDPQLATYQALQELSDDLLQLEQDLLELDEQSAQPEALAAPLRSRLTSALWVDLLSVVERRDAAAILQALEPSEPEEPSPTGDGHVQESAADPLEALLDQPLDNVSARAFVEAVPALLDGIEDSQRRARVEDLRRALDRALRRGRNLGRMENDWRSLGGVASRSRSRSRSGSECPSPATQAPLQRILDWTTKTRTRLGEHAERVSLSPPLVRLKLAEALERKPAAWQELTSRYASVSGATCQRVEYVADADRPFHYAIIDEAGRATPLDLLIPMTLAQRVVLVGDQQQLPPTVEDDLCREVEAGSRDPVNLTEESLFSVLFDSVPYANRIQLDIQYRMHELIGSLVSDLFYPGRLRSWFSGDRAVERLPHLGLLENKSLVWIDTARAMDGHWAQEENREELRVIAAILQWLEDRLDVELLSADEPKVGIITFYAQQRRELRRLLDQHPELKSVVEVGTVDAFQGKDYDIVILSTVKHNSRGNMGFLSLPNRINVAFSRARRQLVILGSVSTASRCEEKPWLGSRYLLEAARRCREDETGRALFMHSGMVDADSLRDGSWWKPEVGR